MAGIDGVKLTDEEVTKHLNANRPSFEFELDQLVYFMNDGKVHSALITSRMYIDNLHGDWNSTPEQRTTWVPWGPTGEYYFTVTGMLREGELFASKEELLASL